MNAATNPAWIALFIQIGLGLAVYRANPKNRINQTFLAVSIFISAWLISLLFAFNARDVARAEFWIRNASASGILVVNGFNLLRLAIVCRDAGWREIGRRAAALSIASVLVIGLCYTQLTLHHAELPQGATEHAPVPHPVYGPLHPLYLLLGGLVMVIVLYAKNLRQSVGVQRVELGYALAGFAALGIFWLLGVLFQPLLPRAVTVRLAPFRVVVFSLIIAYGIATRKIMDVGLLIRRATSYGLLTAYLLALYALVWWLVATVLQPTQLINAHPIAHVTAAIVIAFAMAPARGVSQRLAERLFISAHRLDFRSMMSEATVILKSVTTLSDLLERFAGTIARAVNTERVIILLAEKEIYGQYYPPPTRENRIELPKDHLLLNYLKTSGQPIVLDELHRQRPAPELNRVIAVMRELKLAVLVGISARDYLEGVMLLGPRRSGRIYGSDEQNALQILCGQLAVAIENAELFTEVQNAKIYNETLLENLTTGVIAVGADERITVFNNEAEQITGINSHEILDHALVELPEPVGGALRQTLQAGEGQESSELILRSGDKEVMVRASTSIFHDQDGQMLGALMVLTDITAVKQLELQIRRSDRLASLGTLSAGMAHEIKNPLVSIKTFAQLLPERYQDSDFRETFSNLIGHEIDRIDSLVNQLLRFARPAKPILKPMHVHGVLEKSLTLISHRLYQKEIKLTRFWKANIDTIRADADQLEQVFLNFFLNAIDAMKNGGELTVGTEIRTDERWVSALTQSNGETHEVLRVTIRDSGEGIRSEDIAHVFDPFFTTKDYGTGLGLSVVHGIIQEHGGQIEVESELKKGTAFHILLPLVRLDREVVAA